MDDVGMPFSAILSTLVLSHAPAVRAAIFCDGEGERVDAFALPEEAPFDVDLLGASCSSVARSVPAGSALRVLLGDRVVWLATVDAGYYLVVLAARSRDGAVRFDLLPAVAALAAHM
ncbi:MAG TPA: hypothetical protein VGO62_21200 [Myxococcota bacterium]